MRMELVIENEMCFVLLHSFVRNILLWSIFSGLHLKYNMNSVGLYMKSSLFVSHFNQYWNTQVNISKCK